MPTRRQALKHTIRRIRQKLSRQLHYHTTVKHFYRVDITNQNGRRISASNGRTEPRSPDYTVISDECHVRRQKTLTESLAARQLTIYHQQNLEVRTGGIDWDIPD